MKKITQYNDPIYGQINLTPLQLDLLELPEVQRLSWVNQLGLKNLIYRGATHKRMEHSVGVSYMADQIADHFELIDEDKELVTATGILHDVAHLPFSHTLERITPKNHMQFTPAIFNGEIFPNRSKPTIKEVLNDYSINPEHVYTLITGKYNERDDARPLLQDIIKGPCDADQMDYLPRDAHHTGNSSGNIRQGRIKKVMEEYDGRIVFSEKGMNDLEGFLNARKVMYADVYLHPVSMIPEAMLSKTTKEVIGNFPMEKLVSYVDMEFLCELEKQGEYQSDMVRRIRYRDLFKKSVIVNRNMISDETYKEYISNLENKGSKEEVQAIIEKEISEGTGIDSKRIIVDFPDVVLEKTESRIKSGKIPSILLKNRELKEITELSASAREIWLGSNPIYKFGVYTPKENVKAVNEFVNKEYFEGQLA